MKTLLTGTLLFLACCSLQAREITVTTADGDGADTHIEMGDGKDKNFGASERIQIRNSIHSTQWRKAYLRFDLDRGHDKKGKRKKVGKNSIDSVKLVLDIVTEHPATIENWTFRVYGLKESPSYGVDKLESDWDEGKHTGDKAGKGDITWENAPANVTNYGEKVEEKFTVDLGTFKTQAGKKGLVEFSSDALKEFLKEREEDEITLIIVRETKGNNLLTIASKEGKEGKPPALVVEQ